jgi:hypothetical protein
MTGMLRFTPDQVRDMSLSEAFLAMEGFAEMQQAQAGVRPDEFPTQEEHDELMKLVGRGSSDGK